MFLLFPKSAFKEKGVVIIIASLTLGLLLLLSSYFLSFVIAESKIGESQAVATQAYYLAEAGIHEAIWKLKYDPEWKSAFEEKPGCYTWSDSFLRNNVLLPNSSYQVQIQNSDCARGQIIAIAQINLAEGRTAQRELKVKVFKSLGSLTQNSGVFSGGTAENIKIQSSNINIYNGNLFCNQNLDVKWFSSLTVGDNPATEEILEGKVLVVGNISKVDSSIISTATCSKNVCQGECAEEGCPPSSMDMPSVNFNSPGPDSYYYKAEVLQNNNQCSILCNGVECATNCIYNQSDFENLLWQIGQGGTLTLNSKITYITGLIDLKGERNIIVNGVLVAEGTIDIGERDCWTRQGDKDCGYNQITINDPGVDIPSGLLSKGKINFGPYSSLTNTEIAGLIYAYDDMKIVSLPQSFEVTGGILGRKVSFTSAWSPVNIYLDNNIIAEAIWGGPEPPPGEEPPYSSVVTIEHWEEAY